MILDKVLQGNSFKGRSEITDKDKVSSDKLSRSIAKSISWRVVGTLDTILISWFVTGTIELALSIGFIELVTKMTLYFFHERLWERIKWGK
ncbi:DUF2061 domain-containing protein [Galbibacter orientalis]|uniref:Putative membrane protein n=1 Tax=Galbibacter orientalis DSM 19592 TaxID=926559 RepID=I3C5T6_9FLAO|nr:DUF2061 domain-containing protein [Galbibacter orientalis]EIJ38979.1 putative membrane protein [Galbibacter orientalis DSM 19592]|tara:strand:- start:498 stop:770 length:273 start_codon:yes stop_codon:yes gene_type:complete